MPTVIGQTEEGTDILQYAPEEGCSWRCVTCGNYLRGRREVRGHWALCSRGHSIFRNLRTGKVFHRTVEELFERDWDIAEGGVSGGGRRPRNGGDNMTPPDHAFQLGEQFRFAVGDDMAGVLFQIASRDVAHGMRTYLLVCCDRDCPAPPRIETEEMLAAMREMEAILGE